MTTRPRLTPVIAEVRSAVRAFLAAPQFGNSGDGVAEAGEAPLSEPTPTRTPELPTGAPSATAALVLVALSGGADSLALAAATAFEARRCGIRAGAVVVDHGLQPGSTDVAARAAVQARALGLDPVVIRNVAVGTAGGPEGAARAARYGALAATAAETGAISVFLGHTLDDQAETVLLGIARGSGLGSIKGMAADSGIYGRPLLRVRRKTTERFCADSGLTPWTDPQNAEERFARVRVRTIVLPMLEKELGPGFADALSRTARLAREDADALDRFAEDQLEELAEHAEAGIALPVKALAANPPALRQRIIRMTVQAEFGVSLNRTQTLEIARLVTDWHGQRPLDLPGLTATRQGGLLIFRARAGAREA